jgi:signal transduction histidine kinase
VAHEINNPMGFVASNLNRLVEFSKRLVDGVQGLVPRADLRALGELGDLLGELESIAEETREGVERVVEIVQALLEFSHGGQGRSAPQRVDLNRVVQNCLTLIPRAARERVDLDLRPLPAVACHPMQVAQVVMNLVVNGAQAVQDVGRVRVSTRASRSQVFVSVEDDGCGIPEEHLAQIFDPFFTTKPVGQGTGLGLSVSLEIVRRHRGSLWVDSLPGRGSLFVVELPRDPEPREGAPEDRA